MFSNLAGKEVGSEMLGATPGDGQKGSFVLGGVKAVSTNYATLFILVALCILFSFTTSTFDTANNWSALLVQEAVVGALALGALFPLVVGEFDLSLGYSLGFCTMVGAWAAGKHLSAGEVVLLVVATGAAVGLCNGILTEYLHIGSFISTLAIGIVANSLTLGISGGSVLYSNIPGFITAISDDHFLGLSVSIWLALALAVICHYIVQHTPFGRRMYATGGSERVAFLAGIRTRRIKTVMFVAAGILVGCGAVFHLGQAGAADPSYGADQLLPAYGAAFLGITAYRPGYYNVPGTIIAIVLLAVGFNGLSIWGVPFWVQPFFNGVVLLIAVLLAGRESRHLTQA